MPPTPAVTSSPQPLLREPPAPSSAGSSAAAAARDIAPERSLTAGRSGPCGKEPARKRGQETPYSPPADSQIPGKRYSCWKLRQDGAGMRFHVTRVPAQAGGRQRPGTAQGRPRQGPPRGRGHGQELRLFLCGGAGFAPGHRDIPHHTPQLARVTLGLQHL